MSKETKLNDNASIYQKRSEQSEKQKLSAMTTEGKWLYFKDYYLKIIIVAVIIIAFVAYFLYTILAPKPDVVLHVAVANYPFPEEDVKTIEDEFSAYLDIAPEKEEVFFDTSYSLSENDYTAAERLSVYIAAQELDVFIAPESEFKKYAVFSNFFSLSDQLPTDMYSKLSNQFFSSPICANDNETAETASGPISVYGIYLDQTKLFEKYGPFEDRPIIGIIVNGQNNQNAVEFIRYLFDLGK